VNPDGQNSQIDIQWCLFSGCFESSAMTDDFFRNRLDQMIDLRHPLAVLANRRPWQEIEASLAQRWARQVKAGKKIECLDLFGPVSAVASGGVSNAGRPRLPTCLMVALLCLKHAFNESDEDVIQRWDETPAAPRYSNSCKAKSRPQKPPIRAMFSVCSKSQTLKSSSVPMAASLCAPKCLAAQTRPSPPKISRKASLLALPSQQV
jgi:hypothetical protein